VQTDPPGGAFGGHSGQPLPGLGGDLARGDQQVGQSSTARTNPAAAPGGGRVALTAISQCGGLGLGAAHRLFGVDQQPLGITHRGLRARSASSPVLVSTAAVASSRPRAARERSFAATACARLPAAWERSVPHLGSRSATYGLNPLARRGDPPNRLGQ
jgi:hypothetical protein